MYKICFITTISLTLNVFVLKFAEYLHNTGDFEISMICNTDEEFAKKLPDYINYIPIDMKRGVGFDGFKVIRKLKKIFITNKFDIVQYSTPNASCYASIAAKKARVPVRLYCQWGIAYVGFSGIKRKILKAIEKKICRCSTWIEPDSNSNLKFAHKEKLYKKNVGSVIWNGSACGVDIKKFDFSKRVEYNHEIRKEFSISDDTFVYGYVGRITKDKGINELLYAFRELNDNDSILLLVGPNENDGTIESEIYNWAIANKKIYFTGFQSNVEKFYSCMNCFVLPSYREGFGMSVIEAEAMGTPVIVTNIPGPIDAMIENITGIIIEKKNVVSLKKAMLDIRKDMIRYDLMSKNAKDFAINNFNQKIFYKYMMDDRIKLIKNK